MPSALDQFSDEVGEAVFTDALVTLTSPLAVCNSILPPREQHEIEKAVLLAEAKDRGLL